ncbi:MAG TPA: type II CRISPR-associated endonuclease Cas1 [Candidatus Krumholzibacteria bacterium]|nr:type II CRISPR-associated endonuclease Cas1 [Candidatus Krumholzibacteria bacterium]HPD72512.1 type II CRISPR-associated endonuclease Cas1 [Candidatus Krumholzibacteria bacterium]HRY40556.1 type II CRISPR-associated endonuclease Cas1 [Candidatus Krumholzibacteria bacterium]
MKRTISVATRGTQLALRNTRITITRDDETLADIPAEDLGLIVLESTGISISSGVMAALGKTGGAILACDETFHPCGMFIPLDVHSLHSERVRLQSEMSAPLKKNLWARIVGAKIANQAALLRGDDAVPLRRLAETTRSGNIGAHESQASRIYWPLVFRECAAITKHPFRRHREGAPPNNLLNYGYAVLRAATARALCMAGLQPVIGLHHRNRYSGFCLADDVMEPYRPVVDSVVREFAVQGRLEIDKDVKQGLIGVLYREVSILGESTSLAVALESTASSLAHAIEEQVKNGASAPVAAKELQLPEIQPS